MCVLLYVLAAFDAHLEWPNVNPRVFSHLVFQISTVTKTMYHRTRSIAWASGTTGRYTSTANNSARAVRIAYLPPSTICCRSYPYSCSNSSGGIRTVFSCSSRSCRSVRAPIIIPCDSRAVSDNF